MVVYKIESPALKDLPELSAMVARCIARMRANGIEQWDEIYPNETVLKSDIEQGTIFVCRVGEGLGGCIVLNQEQDPTYAAVSWMYKGEQVGVIHRLMIDPDHQGQGLAKALMLYAEKRAVERGWKAIRLDTFTKNPMALALYVRLGYRQAGLVDLRKGRFVVFEKCLS